LQDASRELVETEPIGSGQLNGAVHRCAHGDVGQSGGDVIGRLGLHLHGR
jgi:hypothetical protein